MNNYFGTRVVFSEKCYELVRIPRRFKEWWFTRPWHPFQMTRIERKPLGGKPTERSNMPTVEDVRVILERTFMMPVAESDAQLVLDRLNEIASNETAQQSVQADGSMWLADYPCPLCGTKRGGICHHDF